MYGIPRGKTIPHPSIPAFKSDILFKIYNLTICKNEKKFPFFLSL
jgi:hypothetical protein